MAKKNANKKPVSVAKDKSTIANEELLENETNVAVEVEDKKAIKLSKQENKNNKVKAVNKEPKKSKVKETFAELKKVTWPTFGKTMRQTGMVLSIVLVFGLVVLGIDTLISFLIGLVTKI